ncbi:DUF1836 domain-containing protein [Domibacillus epiphyticus]|uniref:Cytoplasmic protein n=1 Tax=Domibacillus epiphyticus TaxID=1714355 RepID=A0A1V2AAR7_9BACI|nr:DUF1836 domain-containing protein [Domibacillus epiphyticus]OMP68093.1 hypothetical protein BTO28_03840 [Domibacillus epiphyticus]
MEKLTDLLNELHLENQLTPDDIPNIDLYMDQVIQLFEHTFNRSTRNEDEKVLTKTMINNYAKGKMLFPIKQKKYTKEHLLVISLIYQLKGTLSISDIKTTLDGINEKIDEIDIDSFYSQYLGIAADNVTHFKEDVTSRMTDIKADTKELEHVLLILSLVHMSNMYRKTAEKLVDQLTSK